MPVTHPGAELTYNGSGGLPHRLLEAPGVRSTRGSCWYSVLTSSGIWTGLGLFAHEIYGVTCREVLCQLVSVVLVFP